MISNYSHDHIALDTMNIMANGQYIDINIDINIEYHYYISIFINIHLRMVLNIDKSFIRNINVEYPILL